MSSITDTTIAPVPRRRIRHIGPAIVARAGLRLGDNVFLMVMLLLIGLTFVGDVLSSRLSPTDKLLIAALSLLMVGLAFISPVEESQEWVVWTFAFAYCAAVTPITIIDSGAISVFLYYNAIATVTFVRSPREGFLTLGIASFCILTPLWLDLSESHLSRIISQTGMLPWFGGGVFIVLATNIAVVAEKSRARAEHLLGELDAAHNTLQDYAQKLRAYAATAEELATTRERNRMAREIHDSLGHYLTAINIQLETGLELAERNPERARRSLSEAKRMASEALADVRRSVAALHPATLDGLSATQAITRVVEEFRSLSATPIDLRITGDDSAATASPPVVLALYRAAQETLTNVRKHANANSVRLHVAFDDHAARLVVEDDGVGLPTSLPADGSPAQGGFGPERIAGARRIVGWHVRHRARRIRRHARRDATAACLGRAGDAAAFFVGHFKIVRPLTGLAAPQ